MTREEAANLLNVSVDMPHAEIEKRYQELYSDFQIRLTNAPTPNLKKKYQKNLQEFQEACRILCPGFVQDARDLPSSEPSRQSPQDAPLFAPKAKPQVAVPSAPPSSEIPRSTMVALLAAIFALSVSAFIGMKWFKARQEKMQAEATLVKQNEMMQAMAGELKKGSAVFTNGIFQICNSSSSEMRINALAVAYIDKEGALQIFNSTYYRDGSGQYWLSWVIPPGQSQQFEYVKGMQTVWDGSVLVYTMTVLYKGQEYFISEPWSNVKDKCKKFNFD